MEADQQIKLFAKQFIAQLVSPEISVKRLRTTLTLLLESSGVYYNTIAQQNVMRLGLSVVGTQSSQKKKESSKLNGRKFAANQR